MAFECDKKLLLRYDVYQMFVNIIPLLQSRVALTDKVWIFNMAASGLEEIKAEKRGSKAAKIEGIFTTHPVVHMHCHLSLSDTNNSEKQIYMIDRIMLRESTSV